MKLGDWDIVDDVQNIIDFSKPNQRDLELAISQIILRKRKIFQVLGQDILNSENPTKQTFLLGQDEVYKGFGPLIGAIANLERAWLKKENKQKSPEFWYDFLTNIHGRAQPLLTLIVQQMWHVPLPLEQ